ncbi:MAG: hypothetical protein A3F94_02550 [Candidatus Spechtbacteria bacterium RIFCSPLOWO2_12_FULL_38_22]|uniref:Uncharacterized protein n=1 Tax=Candidatus Spechtbacteria bacterium RIFCSPLOWO2_12_FULL_38_22 TaxID=1802165 RepID=A0A1G2HJL8_9BACT|nr:MAG: hypothetical protein A2728_01125 [Candidatus Spechtbacteria bacterium RIFCSPHIGHO2_01_FULL_38_11]OGZ59459.1 MAG: hypothetical protein A3E58_00760 [Candidatus Spechtbacteria bacterium RIFCSPHIGHO2_12_FULL_38_30]OGZ61144.1 MAG: hypothetical protein A3A00_01060 [Candidatus Spechtbacteria bacterium RIFCSPLOWO2_01_FULL_38_20]OGZ62088.1 MAG: hypothetical protein A3F94_02550 [Candidatus Spechtbacteria bacterium RIFCSPLOWO2_12_FULL_38_22]
MQAPLKFNKRRKSKVNNFLIRIFQRLERWTTLAGFKEFLKHRAKTLLYADGFNKTLGAIGIYGLYLLVTVIQFTTLIILVLSIVGNIAGSTAPMLATIVNSDLTVLEKVKTVTGFTKIISADNDDEKKGELNCSDSSLQWRPDLNTYIKENRIYLKDDKHAGTIILKDPVSSFLGFEISFKSSMSTGINTILSFKNSEGTLKYAIGDGDFKTIRYSFTDKTGILQILETTKLPTSINNQEEIGFKLNTLEKAQGTLVSSTISYTDLYNQNNNKDLNDINITSPKQLYLNIGFGIDANLEDSASQAYLEITNCSIEQNEPSKLLNI